MARVAVPVAEITRAGVSLEAAVSGDPTNGHVIPNDGRVALILANSGSTVPRTVTVHLTHAVDGQLPAPREYPIDAGDTQFVGPWPVSDYGPSLTVDVDNAEIQIQAVRLG